MKTINEIKADILATNPSKIYKINDQEFQQTDVEFEESIQKRAEMEFEQQSIINQMQESKAAAEAKLAALGLTAEDLKALGL